MKHLFLVFLCITAVARAASAEVPECEHFAEAAGRAYGVPVGVMGAIARVESGRTVEGRFRAWPWTLNQGGRGSFHSDKATALQTLRDVLDSGTRNVDIGCMQINWHWHAANFANLSEMMDPDSNTRYAARYLHELYQSLGDWEQAVMQYHSRDPQRGAVYARKVNRELERNGTAISQGAMAVANSTPVMARRGLLTLSQGALIALSPKVASSLQ